MVEHHLLKVQRIMNKGYCIGRGLKPRIKEIKSINNCEKLNRCKIILNLLQSVNEVMHKPSFN